jgi:predicted transcriptional regulator
MIGKVSDLMKAEMRKMREDGMSYRFIAKCLGVSSKTVYVHANGMDWSDYHSPEAAKDAISRCADNIVAKKAMLRDDIAIKVCMRAVYELRETAKLNRKTLNYKRADDLDAMADAVRRVADRRIK